MPATKEILYFGFGSQPPNCLSVYPFCLSAFHFALAALAATVADRRSIFGNFESRSTARTRAFSPLSGEVTWRRRRRLTRRTWQYRSSKLLISLPSFCNEKKGSFPTLDSSVNDVIAGSRTFDLRQIRLPDSDTKSKFLGNLSRAVLLLE